MISGNTNTAMIPTMRAAIDRLDAGLAEAVSRMDQVMDRVRGSQPAVNSLDKIASESAQARLDSAVSRMNRLMELVGELESYL